MTAPFAEYCDVTVTAPLRQGDVLEAVDPDATRWQRNLLVITADCDFAHDKHQGRVTCVPLLRAEEYLLEFQVPRLRERFIAGKLVPAIRRVLTGAGAPNISDERLRAWPHESDTADIVGDLRLSGDDAEVAAAAFDSIRQLGEPCSDLDDAVHKLVDAHLGGPSPQSHDNIVKTVTEALKSPYGQPPGDALFISALGPKHTAGYFAYLRHLEQVWEHEIAIGPTRMAARYRRISRMQDRYTHAMVQRFALVFMSIGLPKEYEETRDFHAELLGDCYK